MKSRGLGRGLSALMGENEETQGLSEVFTASVFPNPDQPRTNFKQEDLEELQDSIAKNGVLQPILVKTIGDNQYQIIAGERRWRASKALGLAYIPAIIKDVTELEALELALIENVQREDLSPLEEAESYKKLIEEYSYTQEKVGLVVSKSRSHIANLMRLFSLSDKVRGYLRDGLINLGHAKLLVAAPNADEIAEVVIKNNLNVRDTEKLINVNKYSSSDPRRPKPEKYFTPLDYDVAAIEESLASVLPGVLVKVNIYADGGTVALHCDNLDQLDLIVRKLSTAV